MDNHLFKQMKEESIKAGYDFDNNIFKLSNELYRIKINTQNNEEDAWKNVQDERVSNEKFIYTNEVGISTGDTMKDLVYFGQCKRSLMFKINNVQSTMRSLDAYEEFERNNFLKNQFINKLKNSKLIVNENVNETTMEGVLIKSTAPIVYDPLEEKEFVLIVKPVNGSAVSVKDNIWPKSEFHCKPMSIHLPEVLTELLVHKKKVKLVYLDKNRASNIKIFTFGLEKSVLYYDDKKFTDFNADNFLESMKEISEFIQDESIVPARSYRTKIQLSSNEVDALFKSKIINSFTAQRLSAGDEYEHFMCNDCQFKEVCNGVQAVKFKR